MMPPRIPGLRCLVSTPVSASVRVCRQVMYWWRPRVSEAETGSPSSHSIPSKNPLSAVGLVRGALFGASRRYLVSDQMEFTAIK